VNSVVGRFLEHSRIYAFERGDECRVYIGSADLMPRNLDHRVELVTPIEDPSLRDEAVDIVNRSLADNTNSWTLDSDGQWTRREPGDDEPRNSQQELMKLHEARAAEHLASAATDG
jgi:polyphosphate kinase